MIWRKNLDGQLFEILNPEFKVCARLWVIADVGRGEFEAPYYLNFYPFADLLPDNATPIIADSVEEAKTIAEAIYTMYDGDSLQGAYMTTHNSPDTEMARLVRIETKLSVFMLDVQTQLSNMEGKIDLLQQTIDEIYPEEGAECQNI